MRMCFSPWCFCEKMVVEFHKYLPLYLVYKDEPLPKQPNLEVVPFAFTLVFHQVNIVEIMQKARLKSRLSLQIFLK